MQKVIIFDMDGTLIDSQHDITVSVNHVRKEHYGLEPLTNAYVVEAINRYQRNLAYLFYETQTYEKHAMEAFEAHYHEQCTQNVYLYKCVREMLHFLNKNGFLLSVATNAPSTFARRMLGELNVDHLFDHIVGADMVEVPKPDKEMLSRILDAYGFAYGRDKAWMVGDNSKDIEAARNASITAVFAAWGFSSEGEGDHFAKHPERLLEIVASSS